MPPVIRWTEVSSEYPNLKEHADDTLSEIRSDLLDTTQEKLLDAVPGVVDDKFRIPLTNETAEALVKDGADAVDLLDTIDNTLGTLDKAIGRLSQRSPHADAVHAASQDIVVWLGSGWAGEVVGGEIVEGAVALGLGTIAATGVGIVAEVGIVALFKWGLPQLLPPPDTNGVLGAEASLGPRFQRLRWRLRPALTDSQDLLSLTVGDVAPRPILIGHTTPAPVRLTVLKPITSDVEAQLEQTAALLDINIPNPMGFTLQGDASPGDLNNVLIGGSGNDTINGGAGDDVLAGRRGDDVIDAGNGNDTVDGGCRQRHDHRQCRR